MLKVELTENYAGVKISGDFDDLDFLYDSIAYLLNEEYKSEEEYTMQNHIYGFLYDVRHAYQGDREAALIDNGLNDSKISWYDFKKKDVTKKNLYFSFNCLLPDVFLDIILVKYFIKKINKKVNDIYNPYINMVNYFYSLVLNSLDNILTETKFNKIKNGLLNSSVSDKTFIPQWFQIISVDYAKMTKKERKKDLTDIMEAIYSHNEYDDYKDMRAHVKKMCKEKNCTLDDLKCGEYPESIEW